MGDKSMPINMSNPKNAFDKDAFDKMAAQYERMAGGGTLEAIEKSIHLLGPLGADSIVHDNAAGTGLATGAILEQQREAGHPAPTIFATDVSDGMLNIMRQRYVTSESRIEVANMSGEKLEYPDDKFTHSVTAFGLGLFPDPPTGAREIYRTLKPGGTALVTGWEYSGMGHVAAMHKFQAAVRPDDAPFKFPAPEKWLHADTLKGALVDAGFGPDGVTVVEEVVHWGVQGGVKELAELFDGMLDPIMLKPLEGTDKAYSDEEKAQLKAAKLKILPDISKVIKRKDGSEWTTVEMTALILVCKK